MIRPKARNRVLALGVVLVRASSPRAADPSGKKSGSAATSPTTASSGTKPDGRDARARGRAGARLRRLDRHAAPVSPGAPWIMQYQTMPLAFDIAKDGDGWKYSPSILLAGEPTAHVDARAGRDLQDQPGRGVVRRHADHLEPTSSTRGTRSRTARTSTARPATRTSPSVDDTDPADRGRHVQAQRVRSVRGGPCSAPTTASGRATSSQARTATRLTKDGYTWSGGPWKIEKWNRGVDVTLVPNDKYWGEKAKISKVDLQVHPRHRRGVQGVPDRRGARRSTRSRSPTSVDLIKKGLPNAKTVYTADTATIEALWMNNAKAPLDSVPVRQAIAYAIDRDAIVTRLFGALGVNKASQSLNPPITASTATSRRGRATRLNLAEGRQLCSPATAGRRAATGSTPRTARSSASPIVTTAGNQRRELTEQILQEQLKAAGIELKIKNQSADQLFGTHARRRAPTSSSIFGQTEHEPRPGPVRASCARRTFRRRRTTSRVRTHTFTNIPALDPLLQAVDLSTDDARARPERDARPTS